MTSKRSLSFLATSALLLAASLPALQAADPPKAPAPEELLKNGDFEKGVANWRGDRKIVVEEGKPENHVAEVVSTKRQARSFQQDIDTRGMKDITLKFRMKPSADYAGRGVQLRFVRHGGGFTFNNMDLKGGEDWKDHTWKFSEINNEPKLTFIVEVEDGDAGSVFFDDFSIVEDKK